MSEILLQYSCATFIGKRKINQDNYLIDGEAPFNFDMINHSDCGICPASDLHIFAVCDGIGGLGDSADISRRTVEILSDCLKNITAEQDPAIAIIETLDKADSVARDISAKSGTRGGTTATVAVIREDECILVNVGDSPAFVLQSDRQFHELTLRHNMETYKIMAGYEPSEGDERILLYGVGAGEAVPSRAAHIARGTLKNGDFLLLCSDGITNAFTENELAGAVLRGVTAQQIALSAGQIDHADNCTAIVIEFMQSD